MTKDRPVAKLPIEITGKMVSAGIYEYVKWLDEGSADEAVVDIFKAMICAIGESPPEANQPPGFPR